MNTQTLQGQPPHWRVVLISRHTGREQVLGVRYTTETEARQAAQSQCQSCNRVEIRREYA